MESIKEELYDKELTIQKIINEKSEYAKKFD
jgi:hypothetical protein